MLDIFIVKCGGTFYYEKCRYADVDKQWFYYINEFISLSE